ncbi:MAG: 50S ribosomal protein L15 [bacterium]|nr:50S ribosomal protein L15 [bacterium]
MLLHELKRKTAQKRAKPTIGRGGKRGNTSGRGQKGQKSRSGHRMRPAERDLIMRLPKLRGYNHKPHKLAMQVVNVKDLDAVAGAVVTRDTLVAAGLIRDAGAPVKILGEGTLAKALTVEKLPVSLSAKKKIEAAGGKVVA